MGIAFKPEEHVYLNRIIKEDEGIPGNSTPGTPKTHKTILLNEQVAGYVACFEQSGEREISYWIGKEYWGRGLATEQVIATEA